MRVRTLATIVAVALIALGQAEGRGTAVRTVLPTGQAQPTPTGTGRIAGVVVDAQARPQPVRRAILMLTAAALPTGRSAVTDDQGRFSFDRLPAGQFTIVASKPAYLRNAYGSVRPGGTGTPIALAAGQHVTDVRLTLPHGSAIAGVIRDASGDPIPGLEISAFRVAAAGARAPARGDAVATTDDRGAYRMFGLPPGAYLVVVQTPRSGGMGEVGVMSAAEVDATFARLRQGRGTTAARGNAPSSIVRPTRPFTATPIFFPGVPGPGAATPITLGVGEERNDIDFVYQLVRSATVSGSIAGGSSPTVALTPDLPFPMPIGFSGGARLMQGAIGPDGAFTFTNVTPGTYTLFARDSPSTSGGRLGGMGGAARGPATHFALRTIDVTGDDITGLALSLQPTLHVTGRVVFEPTTMTPPVDLTRLGVRLLTGTQRVSGAVIINSVASQTSVLAARFRPDGTFDIPGVLPGAYRIATVMEPAGWRPKSAMLGDRDLFDLPLEIGTSNVGGIVVTLADTHSSITGRLLAEGGAPVSRYFVVAFPADRALWVPHSRRLKSARPSTDGQFRFEDLPAGDYVLAAVTDADQEEWQSPEFLAQTMTAGVRLTLADGEKKAQDLRVAR